MDSTTQQHEFGESPALCQLDQTEHQVGQLCQYQMVLQEMLAAGVSQGTTDERCSIQYSICLCYVLRMAHQATHLYHTAVFPRLGTNMAATEGSQKS
jgi:hypothetical protein